MKILFLLVPLFCLTLSAARTDCPGGVCPLPDFPAEAESPASPPMPGEEKWENWHLERKAEGAMGKEEFLRFLRGKPERSAWPDAGPFWICLLTLLAGIALNLTPCVLPMIPVNLLIIGAGENTGGKAWRAVCYGGGMAAAYGVLGVLAALAGVTFGTINSSPYFQIASGLIFLFLAASMTGLFSLPFFSRCHIDARKFTGSPAAVFLLGIFAALMAGACVSPVVAAVLLYTAATFQAGHRWVAGLPFLLGIGMALPWPLAALGLRVLPKPGRKMAVVKMALALLVAGMGIVFCFTGIRALLPAGEAAHSGKGDLAALHQAMRLAREKDLPLLIDFRASWCKNCLAMEKSTLRDPEVRRTLEKDFVFATFSAEDPSDPATREVLERWGITGFPAFVILRSR